MILRLPMIPSFLLQIVSVFPFGDKGDPLLVLGFVVVVVGEQSSCGDALLLARGWSSRGYSQEQSLHFLGSSLSRRPEDRWAHRR